VVARAGRDAGIGEAVLGRDGGHDRLGAVSARHRESVRPGGDGVAHERLEVGARCELDRLDTPRAGLAREVEARGLPASRARVVEEHGVARRRRAGQVGVRPERRARGGEPEPQRGHDGDRDQRVAAEEQDEGHDAEDGGGAEAEDPGGVPAHEPVPAQGQGEDDAGEDRQAAREVDHGRHRGQHDGASREQERTGRGEGLAGHPVRPSRRSAAAGRMVPAGIAPTR
jgi:hypothetical protein